MATYAQDFAKGADKAREHKSNGVALAKLSKLRSEGYKDGYAYGFYESPSRG